MKETEALNIIKQILDQATKAGLFANLEMTNTAVIAYNTIAAKFVEKEEIKQDAQ